MTSTAPQAPAVPAVPVVPAAPAEGGVTPVQNAPESATETPQAEPAKTDEQPEKQGKSRFERKLDRERRLRFEEKARADFYEKQFKEREQAAQTPKNGALKIEDFNYDADKFAEAVEKQAVEKFQTEYKQRQETERHTTAQRALSETWAKAVEKGDDAYDDFHSVVGDLKPNTPWSHAVITAENAHDVAYYLGKHLDEARAISALDPVGQIRAVAKLEAKLLASPPKPNVSEAPAPIKPLGGANVRSDKKLSEMSQDEFEKRRKEQIAKRR